MEKTIAKEVLTVMGFAELTAANSNLFRKQVCAALNGHAAIEIDLSRTTFVDCAGLVALTALRNFAHGRNGAIRLVNPTPPVQQMLGIVRAGYMFEIVHIRPPAIPGSRAEDTGIEVFTASLPPCRGSGILQMGEMPHG